MVKKFFKLGQMTSYKAISILFFVGCIPLIVQSYIIGKYIYMTNTHNKLIETVIIDGVETVVDGQFTIEEVSGALLGVLSFILLLIIWKIICELLIILFRYFERNMNKEL